MSTIRPPFDRHDTWIFDLDNTLYPAECDLFAQIDVRMGAFIQQYLNVDAVEARRIQKTYYRDHGTTLAGLMTNDGVKPKDFLDYVHDIDVTPVPPSPNLENYLERLPGRKIIYTNGSETHARNVMDRLGVTHHFDDIFDIVAANYQPKPDVSAFAQFVSRYGITPKTSVMVEDLPRNLEPAHNMGMATVLIRTERELERGGLFEEADHIHHVADDLISWLESVFPEPKA